MTADLIEHFSLLEDPRIERNKAHALIDIIVLTVFAVASGADGGESIEQFGKEKLDWLRRYIPWSMACPRTIALPMSCPESRPTNSESVL